MSTAGKSKGEATCSSRPGCSTSAPPSHRGVTSPHAAFAAALSGTRGTTVSDRDKSTTGEAIYGWASHLIEPCRDPRDNKFLTLAVVASADLIVDSDDVDLLSLSPLGDFDRGAHLNLLGVQ
jgi:hypothetical protein